MDDNECCKRTPNFKKNQFIALCLSLAEVAICSVRWHSEISILRRYYRLCYPGS